MASFTRITDLAHKKGHYGVEVITGILQKFFDCVHRCVQTCQGEIVKFGGDSCLILISDQHSANDLITRLNDLKSDLLEQFIILNGDLREHYAIDFHVHGGMSCGVVNVNIVGSEQHHLDYFLDGKPVISAYRLCGDAGNGEILDDLAEFCFEDLPAPGETARVDDPPVLLNSADFLPRSVRRKLVQDPSPAELRNAALIFVHLGTEGNADIDLDAYQAIYIQIQRLVYNYDGIINKIDYTEKGYLILVCFGIPFIHADDIERAFLCATQIAKLGNDRIRIKLGINYSNIYAGIIGARERYEYGIIGNAVNIAARLMSFAGTGEVTLTSEIVHRVNSRFEIEPLTSTHVKGIKEPIEIFIVRRELPERWIFYRNTFDHLPLVVMPERIAALTEKLMPEAICPVEISDPEDCIIQITGREGTGKSFLVWHLCHRLFDCGSTIELFYADTLSANLYFDVLHKVLLRKLDIIDLRNQFDVLRQWCLHNGEENTCAGIYAFLYPDHDFKLPPPREYTAQEIEIFYAKLARIVHRLTAGASVIVIDNFDLFDENSRLLLRQLPALCLAANQKVIITAQQDPSLFPQSQQWVDHIVLDRFTIQETQALARGLIANITAQAIDLIHQISDGNPRFLAELIKQILDHYDVQTDLITDNVINDMRNRGQIPDSLENLMVARYEQLNELEKQLLKQTAIFGMPFVFDEMRELFGGLWETHYQEMVLELQRQGFFNTIGYVPNPVFAYVNTIFPDSIYRTILLSEKKKMHLAIATYFEEKHSQDTTKHVAFVAYHYICAGERNKMIPWCKDAADLYLRLGAYEQCRFFLKKIIDNSAYENEICFAALTIADTHLRQANNAEAEQIINRYKYLKDLTGERHDKYISLYTRWLNNTAAFAAIRDFVPKYLDSIGNEDTRIQVHIDYIEALVFNNAVEQVEPEAMPLYKNLSGRHHTAALNKLSGVLAQFFVNQGAYKKALDFYRNKLKYAEKLADLFSQRIAYAGIGIVYARLGRKTLAYRYYQNAIDIAEKIGDRNGYAKAIMDLGTLHRNASEHTKALECYLKSLSIAQHIGNRLLESIVTYNIGELHIFLQDYANARNYILRALAISQKIADHTGVSFCCDALGDICFSEGKLEEAEKLYHSNLDLQTSIKDREGIAHTIGNLGNIAKLRGNIDQARALYLNQYELISEIGDVEDMGKARFNLAMLHLEQNNPQAALEDLRNALILFKQCESLYLAELTEQQIQVAKDMMF